MSNPIEDLKTLIVDEIKSDNLEILRNETREILNKRRALKSKRTDKKKHSKIP